MSNIAVLHVGGNLDGRVEIVPDSMIPLPEIKKAASPHFSDSINPQPWTYDTYRLTRFIVGRYEVQAYVDVKITNLEEAKGRLLSKLAEPFGKPIPKPTMPGVD